MRLIAINKRTLLSILIFLCAIACNHTPGKLPILGNAIIQGRDTIYPAIADFSFVNQDGKTITNQSFSDKIYVADFIFLSCPTICPKMTKGMQTVYNAYDKDPRVMFISHTIDPAHDSIQRLKKYSDNLGVSSAKWFFVTGDKDSIYNVAEKSYFSAAYPDSTSPGGFTHSGGLLLVDKNKHIRGVYNSIKEGESQRLISDIKTLIKEQF